MKYAQFFSPHVHPISWIAFISSLWGASTAEADDRSNSLPFLEAKTLFQTSNAYDPRIDIAVDGVIFHGHGYEQEVVTQAISSWQEKGYTVGRMFFCDSDAGNIYWTGQWDGIEHPDDVERDTNGEVVQCGGERPYMLPTKGWIKYLEEMTIKSIDAGAQAVLPEEPLAHVHTGYEESFKEIWPQRYERPWEPENASPQARFLTAQLKNELYCKLLHALGMVTAKRARELNKSIPFILPVHGLYSNISSSLVAPLGTSITIPQIDGYIGQVWTGPANWSLRKYNSSTEPFFASAYILYDYFVELTVDSGKRLWLLADPVEDNMDHEWRDFEGWYRHCVVAQLFFPEVNAFEVMPWPERIFLPRKNYKNGNREPGPEHFRIVILSAIQALQEMPKGGRWCISSNLDKATNPTQGLGVVVADTMMWQKHAEPLLQGIYSLFIPLVQAGVPVWACVMERCDNPSYLSRFRVLILSYENFKPLKTEYNVSIAEWVKKGGVLIILGPADDLQGADFWWGQLGYQSPLHHLLAELGAAKDIKDREFSSGKGWVMQFATSPRRFADPTPAKEEYLPMVDKALRKAGLAGGLKTPGYFCLRRGPFVVAHAATSPVSIPGKLIDLFDPELPVLNGAHLPCNSSGLYRDVSDIIAGAGGSNDHPCVLHTTHRLISECYTGDVLRIIVRGPTETPAVVRLFKAGKKSTHITARNTGGKTLTVDCQDDPLTLRLRFPNDPTGVVLDISWE